MTSATQPRYRPMIVAGLIAGVAVTFFVEPLLTFVWSAVTSVANQSFSYIADTVYRSAALGHRNQIAVLGLLAAAGAFTGWTLGFLSRRFWRRRKPTDDERVKGLRTQKNRLEIGVILMSGIVALCLLYFASTRFAELQYHTSFEQRLTVLAPHIDEQYEEDLRAQWALMRGRQDYEAFTRRVEEAADSVGVVLPEPLLE